MRLKRVKIFFPLLIILFFIPNSINATSFPQSGISVTVYDNNGYDGSPPLPSVSGAPVQCTTTFPSINQDFSNEICGLNDDFIVKYEGYVTSPVTETITFYPSADDGTQLYIDAVLVDDNWFDKGGGGNPSLPIEFIAGVPKAITLWFYENGGGNWVELSWNAGGNYSIVPAEAFTRNNESPYETTTTTLAPYYNSPTNLTATVNENGSVLLSWDAPAPSNHESLDIYVIEWYDVLEDGSTSAGWGAWTDAENTSYTIDASTLEQTSGYGDVRFGVKAGSNSCAGRQDSLQNCLYGPLTYVDANVFVTPTTTTTSTTTTTEPPVIPEPETTTTTIPEETTTTTVPEEINVPTGTTVAPETEVPLETPPSTSNPESNEPITEIPQYAPENETPSTPEPEMVVPEEVQTSVDNEVVAISDSPMTDTQLENAVGDLVENADSPEELTAVVSSLLEQELTDEQFSTVIDTVFSEPLSDENFTAAVEAVFSDTSSLSDEQFNAAVTAVFDEPLSAEQFSEALDAVFEEPLSDEKFDAVIDAVLENPLTEEQFEELVGVLESDSVSEEQVAAAVDSIIETGVSEEQATELATSGKVLESIDGEQATEIFAAVEISAVTPEEAAQIVDAVQEAPKEVRESFEEEINVFQGAIDTYVPLGSSVPIKTRRVLIGAGALAIFSAPVPASRRK